MCGIYGIVSLRAGHTPDPALLDGMAAVTHHRGPDDEGAYSDASIAMGMRRLSIIDLNTGHQPIANEDETLWVICNGEVYNFRELRADLEGRGHRFRTGSDSEVILHLYEEYGADCVDHMEGMFGFALWDAPRQRMVLGRDRLGIKVLYYWRDADRLIFASEAKAILTVPEVVRTIDPVALEEYLTFGYTPSDRSIFAGIAKLPPACVMVCEGGTVDVRTYWQTPSEADESLTEGQWAEQVLAKIESAVVSQMVSDVPLGAFLSGGIDSSCIVALMARHSTHPVRTYSIGFDTGSAGAFYNELPYAREVAELCETAHKEILVRPDVAQLLPKLLWHMDEPVSDSAFVTTYLVSEFARQDVTVILSGVGGDELFGGYFRYLGEHYVERYHRLPGWLRRRLIAPLLRLLPADRHSPLANWARLARGFAESSDLPLDARYRSYMEVFGPESLDRLLKARRSGDADTLDKAFAVATEGDGLNRLLQVDLLTQMPNDLLMLTDKMTMAASIECRVPLLNHELVELGARIPADHRIRGRDLKHILKAALKGVLPDSILYRKKRGFGAPMGAWLKAELAPLMDHMLSRESVDRRGLFEWSEIERTMALHKARREDHTDHLLSLLNLEIWARLYLDDQAPDDLARELAGVAR